MSTLTHNGPKSVNKQAGCETDTDTKNRGESARSGIGEHVDTIRDDVGVLKDDLTSVAGELGHAAQQKVDQVAAVAKTGSEKAQEAHDSICKIVAKRPTASVLLALGAGVMIGRILGGK